MTYTPDETDFDRWLDSLTPAQREQITRDIEAAEERIARQDSQTGADDWHEWYHTMRAEVRAQALAPIRAALAHHPRCDIRPDDDPIKCGWERADADIQAVLDREEQP